MKIRTCRRGPSQRQHHGTYCSTRTKVGHTLLHISGFSYRTKDRLKLAEIRLKFLRTSCNHQTHRNSDYFTRTSCRTVELLSVVVPHHSSKKSPAPALLLLLQPAQSLLLVPTKSPINSFIDSIDKVAIVLPIAEQSISWHPL